MRKLKIQLFPATFSKLKIQISGDHDSKSPCPSSFLTLHFSQYFHLLNSYGLSPVTVVPQYVVYKPLKLQSSFKNRILSYGTSTHRTLVKLP
jgi:hypothetical protein